MADTICCSTCNSIEANWAIAMVHPNSGTFPVVVAILKCAGCSLAIETVPASEVEGFLDRQSIHGRQLHQEETWSVGSV